MDKPICYLAVGRPSFLQGSLQVHLLRAAVTRIKRALIWGLCASNRNLLSRGSLATQHERVYFMVFQFLR